MPTTPREPYRFLKLHLWLFSSAVAVLVVGNLVAGTDTWLVWPALIWGFVVVLHALYAKSVRVDSRWAEQRARDVAETACDAGHIEDIRKRYRDPKPD